MKLSTLQAGAVVVCSGTGWFSRVIELVTLGPISHAGILCEWPGDDGLEIVLSESEYENDLPCLMTGKRHPGVAVHSLQERLREYADTGGQVWVCHLTRPLSRRESVRLTAYCCKTARDGVDYDWLQAVRSARPSRWLFGLGKPDPRKVYCSEHVAFALAHIGRIELANPSAMNPNALYRYLVRNNIVQPKELLTESRRVT